MERCLTPAELPGTGSLGRGLYGEHVRQSTWDWKSEQPLLVGFNLLPIPFDITQVGNGSPGLLGARLLSWTLPVPCHMPASQPSWSPCLPTVPHLGQLRHRRPFHVESAQSGSPGEGVRSRQYLAGRACCGDKDEVSIFWNGVKETDGCPLASRRKGGTAEAPKRSALLSSLPETSEPSLRHLVIVQTLRPCMARPVPLAGRMLGSPESLSLPCPLLCTSPVPLSGCYSSLW